MSSLSQARDAIAPRCVCGRRAAGPPSRAFNSADRSLHTFAGTASLRSLPVLLSFEFARASTAQSDQGLEL